MHMPGFRNHKQAPPYRVRIIEDNSEHPRYSHAEFIKMMELGNQRIPSPPVAAVEADANPPGDGLCTALKKALATIDADDYTTWCTVLMALKHLEDKGHSFAKDLAQEYSKRSAKYDAEALEEKWAS